MKKSVIALSILMQQACATPPTEEHKNSTAAAIKGTCTLEDGLELHDQTVRSCLNVGKKFSQEQKKGEPPIIVTWSPQDEQGTSPKTNSSKRYQCNTFYNALQNASSSICTPLFMLGQKGPKDLLNEPLGISEMAKERNVVKDAIREFRQALKRITEYNHQDFYLFESDTTPTEDATTLENIISKYEENILQNKIPPLSNDERERLNDAIKNANEIKKIEKYTPETPFLPKGVHFS